MVIEIEDCRLRLQHMKTRMPFRYGIATMTEFPLAFLGMRALLDGRPAWGVSSDLLPPKWFTKIPDKPVGEEIAQMEEVLRHAMELARGRKAESVFDLWQGIHRDQAGYGERSGVPPLLAHFGTSMVERALIDAFCRGSGSSFARAAASNSLGVRLGEMHAGLEGSAPGRWLPGRPLERVVARHTLGLSDPLYSADIPREERLEDGLPQSLQDCIARYGLAHFKIKVSGSLDADRERLERFCALLRECRVEGARFTVDGNEQFATAEAFREYWEGLSRSGWFPQLAQGLLFVEQPLHRDAALEEGAGRVLREWRERPRLIIDESDGEIGSLPRALDLGYHGTSHKNCKGVIRGIASRCLIEQRRRAEPGPWILSGEDLCNQGPVALLQDLCAMSVLGVGSVERNGHHYCAGLSHLDPALQRTMLEHHPDLYRRSPRGWPTLRIEEGSIALGSVLAAPFGVAPLLRSLAADRP